MESVTCQDGDVDFEFIAGDVSLDFIATVSERTSTALERLVEPADLAAWLVGAAVVDRAPAAADADLTAARELREALYPYVLALTGQRSPPAQAVTVINRFARRPPPVVQLDPSSRPSAFGDVSSALSRVARSGIELAAADQVPLIRWCAGPACTRAFLDLSRGRRRIWCSMASCGDKAKAKAYRDRNEIHRR